MTTDREYRLYEQKFPTDEDKKGDLKWANGEIRIGIKVEGQTLSIDFSKVYADDAMAAIRDMYGELNAQYPSPYYKDIVSYLNKAIYVADVRAVERHGYSWSKEEANLKLPDNYDGSKE